MTKQDELKKEMEEIEGMCKIYIKHNSKVDYRACLNHNGYYQLEEELKEYNETE